MVLHRDEHVREDTRTTWNVLMDTFGDSAIPRRSWHRIRLRTWAVSGSQCGSAHPCARRRTQGAQARVVNNGTSPRALPIQGGRLQPISRRRFGADIARARTTNIRLQRRVFNSLFVPQPIGEHRGVAWRAARSRLLSDLWRPPMYDRLQEVDCLPGPRCRGARRHTGSASGPVGSPPWRLATTAAMGDVSIEPAPVSPLETQHRAECGMVLNVR
jgi:hypothetical protein